MIGGFLGSFSWHHPFAVHFIGIPIVFIALIAVPEIRIEKTSKEIKETTVLEILRGRPILIAIYGFLFISHVFLYVLMIFLPQRLEKIDTSNPFHISLFITALAIAAALTSFRYHRIRSKLSYKMIFLVTLALSAIGFTAISKFSFIILVILSLAILGMGFGMAFPTVPLLIGEIVPVSFRGRFSSYIGTFLFIGQFLSPIVFAPIFVLLGLNGVFPVAAGFSALVFITITVVDRMR